MAEQNNQNRDDQYRDARDLGRRSPASEEAQAQNASGQRGGARGDKPAPETPDQPAQTSGRRGAQHQEPGTERKSFAEGQAPSEQGDGSPSPAQIAKSQAQQGMKRQSGSHSAQGERSEEAAMSGEPREAHTRHAQHGRQGVPGGEDRPQG